MVPFKYLLVAFLLGLLLARGLLDVVEHYDEEMHPWVEEMGQGPPPSSDNGP